jgi:hypothetical protein
MQQIHMTSTESEPTSNYAQWIPALDELFALSADELEAVGVAHMSLVCAMGLAGAEDLNVAAYLERIRQWADFVRSCMPDFQPLFDKNPAKYLGSHSFFRMVTLVHILQKHFGVHGNPIWVHHDDLHQALPDGEQDRPPVAFIPPRPSPIRTTRLAGRR